MEEDAAPPPVVLRVVGPVVRGDLHALCTEVERMLAGVEPGRQVLCDVGGLGTPDALTLEVLAKLQLIVRRLGCRMRLHDPSPQLLWLLARAGLSEVVGAPPGRTGHDADDAPPGCAPPGCAPPG